MAQRLPLAPRARTCAPETKDCCPRDDSLRTQYSSYHERDDTAATAAEHVLKMRARLARTSAVIEELSPISCHSSYHIAVAMGLNGRAAEAAGILNSVFEGAELETEWAKEFDRRCRELAEVVTDGERFKYAVNDLIEEHRANLKMQARS